MDVSYGCVVLVCLCACVGLYVGVHATPHSHIHPGVQAAAHSAFVLVAGGLGERLGYSGIKLALPAETARGACFLQVYIESILALQQLGPPGTRLPLAIMTSDDTHARTEALLKVHSNFGMQEGQVVLIKQEKVWVYLEDGEGCCTWVSSRTHLLTHRWHVCRTTWHTSHSTPPTPMPYKPNHMGMGTCTHCSIHLGWHSSGNKLECSGLHFSKIPMHWCFGGSLLHLVRSADGGVCCLFVVVFCIVFC